MSHANGQLRASRLSDELRVLREAHHDLRMKLVSSVSHGDAPGRAGALGLARLLDEHSKAEDLAMCKLICDELLQILRRPKENLRLAKEQEKDPTQAAAEVAWCGSQVGFLPRSRSRDQKHQELDGHT